MGQISVTVAQADRLRAINNMAKAIKNLSEALISNVVVNIDGCNISNTDIGINIDTAEDITETFIKEL